MLALSSNPIKLYNNRTKQVHNNDWKCKIRLPIGYKMTKVVWMYECVLWDT